MMAKDNIRETEPVNDGSHAIRKFTVADFLIMLILIALGVLSFSYYFFIYGERMTDSVSIEYP